MPARKPRPILWPREWEVVDDAIYNEIGDLLVERASSDGEEKRQLNNRIRNLMKARSKLREIQDG